MLFYVIILYTVSSKPSSPKTKLKEIIKMKNQKKVFRLTAGALVAAVYVCLSIAPLLNSLSYGPVQFRVSEALMTGCVISPACAAGVGIGCFLANLFSPYGANVFDLVFGTGATVLAAVLTYLLRRFFEKNKFTILLSPLPTIILNAVVVGSYLPYVTGAGANLYAVLYCMLTVGLGEAAVLYILGIPLYYFMKRKKIFKD